MKKDKKIYVLQIKKAVERYENIEISDEEWDVGLYGWRTKHKYHVQKVSKGWITEKEALSLIRYLTFPEALFTKVEDSVFIF